MHNIHHVRKRTASYSLLISRNPYVIVRAAADCRLLCPQYRRLRRRTNQSQESTIPHGRELISLRVTLREDEPNTINDLLPIMNVIIY